METFIHLGDLHLGIKFHKRSLLEDQKDMLIRVCRCAEERKAHTVIAGDIFDSVNPSIEAHRLWFDFLTTLGQSNMQNETHTYVIAGNHDSASRLALGREFLEAANIHIVRSENTFEVHTCNGINLVCVPFFKPTDLDNEPGYEKLDTRALSYSDGYKLLIDDISKIVDPSRSVLIAHQSFEGCVTGESEYKPFMSDSIDPNVVSAFRKVWAGHIHSHQRVGTNIYYSGSLLPYAFGDDYNPGISIWTYDGDGWEHSRVVEGFKPTHALKTYTGNLKHCLEFKNNTDYVKIKLLNCEHFDEALIQLQEHFPLLCAVTTDSADNWEADLEKEIAAFGTLQEAVNAFCEHIEVPKFTGNYEVIIQEAIDAYSKIEN